MNGQEPAITQNDPRAYFLWLQTQGFPPVQAVQLVQQRFGAPKSPDEQARDAARQQQNQALAQTGGQILGTVGGAYLGGQLIGGGAAGAGAAGAGAAGAGAAGAAGAGAAGAAGAGAAGAAGAGGASGAATGAGAGAGLGSAAATAGIVGAIIIGLQNLYETGGKDILKGRATRSDWLNMAFPNMLPRLLGRKSFGKALTSGKSYIQEQRDDFRGLMRQLNVSDKNNEVTLADGTKFNIGLDGKTRYQNVGENIDGKTTRRAWDVDFSNPLAKFAVDQIDPLIRTLYQQSKGLKPEQYTGMLVNAVTSNAQSKEQIMANINSILGNSQLASMAGIQGGNNNIQTRPPAPFTNQPQPNQQSQDNSLKAILERKLREAQAKNG